MTVPPLSSARVETSHPGAAMLSVVLLSAWLGAAIFFSAVVARAAFRVLPTRTLAGALVGNTLPVLFIVGIVIGVIAALLALRDSPLAGARVLRVATSLGMALACGIAQFWIGAHIDRLRASLGADLATLAPGDPMRVAFGRLHGLSVLALAIAIVLALVALIANFNRFAQVLRYPIGR